LNGLEQATSGVVSSGAGIQQAEAELAAAKARVEETDVESAIRQQRSPSVSEREARRFAHGRTIADMAAAEARVAAARAATAGARDRLAAARLRMRKVATTDDDQVAMARANIDLASAKVAQAEVAAKLAQRAISFRYVHAPARGVVWRRIGDVGQLASPDQPLLALSDSIAP
jgi:multidrug resistance efflux pump